MENKVYPCSIDVNEFIKLLDRFSYQGSNSWMILSKRITANRRLAKPPNQARKRTVKVSRDCHPMVWDLTSFSVILVSSLSVSLDTRSTSILDSQRRTATLCDSRPIRLQHKDFRYQATILRLPLSSWGRGRSLFLFLFFILFLFVFFFLSFFSYS